MIKKYITVFFICLSLPGFSSHAANVRIEFEGQITGTTENTFLPDLQVGDVITGYYDLDTDVAPTDSSIDPTTGIYAVYNQTPSTFIVKAVAVIGNKTFVISEIGESISTTISITDSDTEDYQITTWSDQCGRRRVSQCFKLSTNVINVNSTINMLEGDGIEQNFEISHLPGNATTDAARGADIDALKNLFSNYLTGYSHGNFRYELDENIKLSTTFSIINYKVHTVGVDLNGTVKTPEEQDICAMILASGKFMFSCDPMGVLSLNDLPRETDGTIKRQIYADGFFPKIDILTGSTDEVVVMTRSGTCPDYNLLADPGFFPDSAGKWIDISGQVVVGEHQQTPICALVLANGQHMFSCDGEGNYAINVPLDDNGQVKLQVYADGFAPTILNIDEFSANNDVKMARALECQ